MYGEWYGVGDFVVLSVVEVCVDYGGVNMFHVCLNFGMIYGAGVCVNVCVVVCCLFRTSGCCFFQRKNLCHKNSIQKGKHNVRKNILKTSIYMIKLITICTFSLSS